MIRFEERCDLQKGHNELWRGAIGWLTKAEGSFCYWLIEINNNRSFNIQDMIGGRQQEKI